MTRSSSPVDPVQGAISRIVVGFVGSRRCDALIDLAATYAHALQVGLKGIYVREQRLLDVAGLPFALTFRPGPGGSQALSVASLEQAWLREEERYRRAIVERLNVHAVEWTCETTRDSVEVCLRRSAVAGDLVILVADSRNPLRALAAGGVAELAHSAHSVLLVGSAQGRVRSGSILAIDDGSPDSPAIVRIASQLALATGQPLEVLRSAPPSGALEPRMHRGHAQGGGSLRVFLRQPDPSLIVTGAHALGAGADPSLHELIRLSAAPVLLVG